MREPPIVNQQNLYSDQFGSSSGVPQFQEHSVDPGARRRLLTAFGITFVVLFALCGGLSTWVYLSVNGGSEMSAQYREHREPTGSKLNDSFITVMNEASPQASEDIETVKEFLGELQEIEDVDEVIDYARVVDEIEHSGLSVGVNFLTKTFWIDHIQEAVELPALGDTNEVIDFEWLKDEEEARAVVASYSAWENDPRIHLIYLTRASGAWKIYDSRDLLVPMSEAQYLAAYIAAPPGLDDNVAELGEELSEINVSDDDDESKSKRSLAAFRRRTYPKSMRPYAESLTGDYLLIYQDVETLKQFCSQLPDTSYPGSQRVKGSLALLDGDNDEAFLRAKKLIEQIGWHPTAALMAGEAAESAADKKQAAQWLARSVMIAPSHQLSVEQFFEIADNDEQEQLLTRLTELPDAASRFLELCEFASSDQLNSLSSIAERFPSLSTVVTYAKLMAIEPTSDVERLSIIELANTLLTAPEFEAIFVDQQPESESAYISGPLHELWRKFLDASTAPGMLEKAVASSSDRTEFMRRLRRRITEEWYFGADWEDLLRVLQAETDSTDDPLAEAAVGVVLYNLDKHSEAARKLIPFVSKNRDEILAYDSPPGYAYTVMNAVATAAVESEQMQELIGAIDEPETAFVVLSAGLLADEHLSKLEELIDWYASSNAPQLWRHYYQGQLEYARGNWDSADVGMAKAIELGDVDERLEDYTLRSIVYDFAPYTDYISEWADQRATIATRSGRLLDFIKRVQDAEEFESTYAYSLSYSPEYEMAPDEIRTISELLRESEDEYLIRRSTSLLSELAARTGDYQSAVEHAIAAAQMQSETNYYGNQDFASAVRLVATHGQWEQLDALRGLSSDVDDNHMLQALVALSEGDAEQFTAAVQSYENEYRVRFWFSDPDLIAALKKAGIWREANSKFQADLDSITGRATATGALLLKQPATEVLNELEEAFRKISGPVQAVASERFPQSVGGWYADVEQGRLVMIAYDEFASDIAATVPEAIAESTVGVLGIALIQSPGQMAPTKSLRELAVEFTQSLPAINGYVDYAGDSWFLASADGDAWTDRMQAATAHGINRNSPMTRYFPWRYYGTDEATQPNRRGIGVGLILEELIVEPISTSEDNAEADLLILQQPSVLIPILAPGDRVQ